MPGQYMVSISAQAARPLNEVGAPEPPPYRPPLAGEGREGVVKQALTRCRSFRPRCGYKIITELSRLGSSQNDAGSPVRSHRNIRETRGCYEVVRRRPTLGIPVSDRRRRCAERRTVSSVRPVRDVLYCG
jgi:hypothetical protein